MSSKKLVDNLVSGESLFSGLQMATYFYPQVAKCSQEKLTLKAPAPLMRAVPS